jgi:uncharacterized protein
MSAIDLRNEQLILVKTILSAQLPTNAAVWLFGSRATGKAKPYSDIDLAIDAGQPLSLDLLANLSDSFENSALPYKVDVVDWQSIDDTFRKIIERDGKQIL